MMLYGFTTYNVMLIHFVYTEKAKTESPESDKILIDIDSTNCHSVEIILPIDMGNIGILSLLLSIMV